MSVPFDAIGSSAQTLDRTSILDQETSILLNVTQDAANALKDVGLSTIFDLASSSLFADAVDICLLANGGQGRFASTDKVPHNVLRSDHNTLISLSLWQRQKAIHFLLIFFHCQKGTKTREE